MINIEINVGHEEIHNALVDLGDEYGDGLVDFLVGVVESVGSPRVAKDLIGKLGGTYTYLEETFGDGAE